MNAIGNDEQPPVPTEESAQDVSVPVQRPRWRQWSSKLYWRAHCLAPYLVPHPGGKLEFDTERDQEENEKSRIEVGRNLRAPMIWGVELYGPAEISSLYAGLSRLGWSRAGGWKPEHDAEDQVRRMRSNGAGSWLNIGHVRGRSASGSFPLNDNYAPLPHGVESLIVGASQITASLTAVVIGFHLEESFATRYESEINTDRQMHRRRIPRSWTVEWNGPGHQKEEAVASVRRDSRAMVGAWFSRHLPGYFSALNLEERFPTMELLVARGISLRESDEPSSRRQFDWQRLLVNTSPYDVWDSNDNPGLQLGLEHCYDSNTGLHVYITLDPSALPDSALEGRGERSSRAYSWHCDRMFSGFLVHMAAIEYLKIHAQELHTTRERLKLTRSNSRNVAKTLDEIGRFFDTTLGSPAIIRELVVHSESEVWFRRSCEDFGSKPFEDEEHRMLYADVQSGVRNRSMRLMEDEAALRTHFEQLTTILSVRESIRLQRRTLLLTLITVGVALGSLAVAIYGPTIIDSAMTLIAETIEFIKK